MIALLRGADLEFTSREVPRYSGTPCRMAGSLPCRRRAGLKTRKMDADDEERRRFKSRTQFSLCCPMPDRSLADCSAVSLARLVVESGCLDYPPRVCVRPSLRQPSINTLGRALQSAFSAVGYLLNSTTSKTESVVPLQLVLSLRLDLGSVGGVPRFDQLMVQSDDPRNF